MKLKLFLLIFIVFGWTLLSSAPFYSKNAYFFSNIFGTPHPQSAFPKSRFVFLVKTSNTSTYDSEDKLYRLVIDGETQNFVLIYEKKSLPQTSFGTQIKIIGHNSGVLDGAIDGFHNLISWENAPRNSFENDNFFYFMRVKSETHSLEKDYFGLGDLTLFLKHRLVSDEKLGVHSLQISVELPTGDPSKFSGNGFLDFAITLLSNKVYKRLSFDSGLGALYVPNSKIFGDYVKHLSLFSHFTIGYEVVDWFKPKLQLDFSTPTFKETKSEILDNNTLQGSLGFSIYQSGGLRYDFCLTEDIFVRSTPDITALFAITKDF